MDFEARLPAPMASITVAEPVTISPPAYTPGRFVAQVSGSTTILPHLFSSRPFVLAVRSGLATVPSAGIAVSQSIPPGEVAMLDEAGELLSLGEAKPSGVVQPTKVLVDTHAMRNGQRKNGD